VTPYYDRAGQPIDLTRFSQLLADQEYKRVAETTVGPYWVSTVWLGLDHGFGTGSRPVIFETMVFAGPDDGTLGPDMDCRRYCTEAEARTGHEETVLLVRATLQDCEDRL
jgi:hypothetical protein